MAEKYTLTQGAAQWLVEKIKGADNGVKELKNHTRVNLLRPTLGTTTVNGVTCTNNGDGTYTLNGTATSQANFTLLSRTTNTYKGMKVVGCPSGGSTSAYSVLISYTNSSGEWLDENYDEGVGCIVGGYDYIGFGILIRSGTVCNNLVFKPMLTTDLDATYDDFVSYEDSLAINKNAAQKQDVLTYEEIQASTDLSGKIASASALKDTLSKMLFRNEMVDYGFLSVTNLDSWVNALSGKATMFCFINCTDLYNLNAGNRQYVLGWINAETTYGWVIIASFNCLYYGKRESSSAFTFTKIT